MSATAFLNHRRAVAVKYVETFSGRSKTNQAIVADAMERYGLSPGDFANLAGNNDVLKIADELAAARLEQPELDDLEKLNVFDVGDRAAVHSPEIRAEQVEDQLQHPCQETVGVSNMHDGPEAALALANPSKALIDDHDGDVAAAAAAAVAEDDALANHDGLPAAAPSMDPQAEAITAESDKPTDPAGAADTPATIVDGDSAVAALKENAATSDKLVKLGEDALGTMDRDALIAYAATAEIDLGDVKERTTPATLRKRILDAQAAPVEKEINSNG